MHEAPSEYAQICKCIALLAEDSTDLNQFNQFRDSNKSLCSLLDVTDWLLVALDFDEANLEYTTSTFEFNSEVDCTPIHTHLCSSRLVQEIPWFNAEITKYHEASSSEVQKLTGLEHTSKGYIVIFLAVGGIKVGYLLFEKSQFNVDFDTHFLLLNSLSNMLHARSRIKREKMQVDMYQSVLDLMPQRVFWKNRDSIYLGANQAFATDANLTSAKLLIGKSDFDFFPDQAELYRSDDKNTMQTRKFLIASEEPQTHANGNTIWLSTSKCPIINHHDIVVGMVGTYSDITKLKHIQEELEISKNELEDRVQTRTKDLHKSNTLLNQTLEELQQAQEHLVQAEKMASLGGLVAGVSHEINTPIGISVTASSLQVDKIKQLRKAFKSGNLTQTAFEQSFEKIEEGANIVLKNLDRASNLIQNFKQVAVDQSADKPRMLNLKDHIESLLQTLKPVFKKSPVEYHINIQSDINIRTYPGALTQLITNLVENAILHAFPENRKGLLSIECHSDENGQINITFSDDGIGVKKNHVKKIFDPFFTTRRGQGGSGLGLNIVYNLITQRLHGKITCESSSSTGTQFNITFPASLPTN